MLSTVLLSVKFHRSILLGVVILTWRILCTYGTIRKFILPPPPPPLSLLPCLPVSLSDCWLSLPRSAGNSFKLFGKIIIYQSLSHISQTIIYLFFKRLRCCYKHAYFHRHKFFQHFFNLQAVLVNIKHTQTYLHVCHHLHSLKQTNFQSPIALFP